MSCNMQSPSLTNSRELYICEYPDCKKIFTTKFSWQRHQYIHSGEKPYKCDHCGKKFSLIQSLKEHSFTHTRERPFICGINGCTYSCRHPSELSLHKRHHPEYKLRNYRYLITKSHTLSEKILKPKFLIVKIKSNTKTKFNNNIEIEPKNGSGSLGYESPKTEFNEIVKEYYKLDTEFLKYMMNICTFKEEAKRPNLPLPTA